MTEDPRRAGHHARATAWFRGGSRTWGLIGGILGEYASAMRSYRLPRLELRRLQERKLRKLISFAFESVPYYHNVMSAQGLTPSDFSKVEDLRRLPLLTKEMVADSPEGFLARGVPPKTEKTTSGTTGRPVTFYRGPLTERRIVALRLRRTQMAGVHWWEKEAYVKHSLSKVIPKEASMRRINLVSHPAEAKDVVAGYREMTINPRNLQAVSRLLVRYKPSVLRGRPSHLRRLSGFVKENDPSFKVRRIITEGEVLTKGTREDLHSIYGGEVFDHYGCIEFTGLGSECKSHDGLHMYADYFVFEFLAGDGQPADEGERAELVVTGLVDDTMPLIRYRLGDIVVRDEDNGCPCGSSLPRLKQVDGRASDGLVTSMGGLVPPNPIVEYLESTIGLREFQLVQESLTELLLKVHGPLDESIAKSVREYVSHVLGGEISLRAEPWMKDEMPIKLRPVMMSAHLKNSRFKPTV